MQFCSKVAVAPSSFRLLNSAIYERQHTRRPCDENQPHQTVSGSQSPQQSFPSTPGAVTIATAAYLPPHCQQSATMQDTEDIHLLLQPDRASEEHRVSPAVRQVVKRPRAKTAPARPVEHHVDTSRFLRKNQKTRLPPAIDKTQYQCVLNSRRPPVPKTVEPVTERTTPNFVKKNVKAAASMDAKPHAPIVVVSCKGDRRDLTRFLEARQLRESESFGKVPRYLTSRRKCWQVEGARRQEELERLKKEEEDPMRGYRQVSEEDRQMLLKGLKDRWMEVHKEFLMLPVLCDTAPKVKRKLMLEKKLAALEKDIELLETNPYIFLDKKNN